MSDTQVDKQTQRKPYQGAYRAQLDEPDVVPNPEVDPANPDTPPVDALPEPQTPEEVTFKKRYSDLRSYSAKKQKAMEDELAQARALLSEKRDGYKPPKTKEEIEKWSAEYPEVRDVIMTLADERAADRVKELEAQVKSISTDQTKLKQERALALIMQAHPDFLTIRDSGDLAEWADTQPKNIQDWLFDNFDNAELCISAVNLYKVAKGVYSSPSAPGTKVSKKDAATAVGIKDSPPNPGKDGKKIWKMSEIAKLSSPEFERLEEEIDAAQREGRIREG